MPNLTGYAYDGTGKREGVKFGAQTVRMIRRKRARQAAKHEQKNVSSCNTQVTKGFA